MKVLKVARFLKTRKGKIITGCGCSCTFLLSGLIILLVIVGAFMLLVAQNSSNNSSIIQANEYGELVVKYATEMEVEPALVMAVIKAESNFNPNAVSPVGAKGLMQMMPTTFEGMQKNFFPNDPPYTEDDLFNPDISIKYGTKYLSETLKKYGNIKETAVASYNAGQGAVDGWLKNSAYSSDGKTLQYIPYSETRSYVEIVMKYYNEYLQQSTLDPSTPPSFDGETSDFGFVWPCPGTTVITSYWGDGRGHKGLDISGADCYGKPIVAAQDGTVTWSNQSGWGGGYGLGVFISHGNGIATRYGHMSNNLVHVGDKVKRGQVIGYIGSTGDSSGPHLHFEVRINDVPVDALKYLPKPN